MIWAILAEKNENKVYVNPDESLTDLQTLIKYSFLLNFLHESFDLMNLLIRSILNCIRSSIGNQWSSLPPTTKAMGSSPVSHIWSHVGSQLYRNYIPPTISPHLHSHLPTPSTLLFFSLVFKFFRPFSQLQRLSLPVLYPRIFFPTSKFFTTFLSEDCFLVITWTPMLQKEFTTRFLILKYLHHKWTRKNTLYDILYNTYLRSAICRIPQ